MKGKCMNRPRNNETQWIKNYSEVLMAPCLKPVKTVHQTLRGVFNGVYKMAGD